MLTNSKDSFALAHNHWEINQWAYQSYNYMYLIQVLIVYSDNEFLQMVISMNESKGGLKCCWIYKMIQLSCCYPYWLMETWLHCLLWRKPGEKQQLGCYNYPLLDMRHTFYCMFRVHLLVSGKRRAFDPWKQNVKKFYWTIVTIKLTDKLVWKEFCFK